MGKTVDKITVGSETYIREGLVKARISRALAQARRKLGRELTRANAQEVGRLTAMRDREIAAEMEGKKK